jgi:hypothetical protein
MPVPAGVHRDPGLGGRVDGLLTAQVNSSRGGDVYAKKGKA